MGWFTVEVDLHPHVAQWRDKMLLLGFHDPYDTRFENDFGSRLDIGETQGAFQDADDAPNPRLGSMIAAQSGGDCVLIEHWCLTIGFGHHVVRLWLEKSLLVLWRTGNHGAWKA